MPVEFAFLGWFLLLIVGASHVSTSILLKRAWKREDRHLQRIDELLKLK